MQTKEEAEVILWNAQAISQLVYAGYNLESARDAVTQKDLSLLKEEGSKKNDS